MKIIFIKRLVLMSIVTNVSPQAQDCPQITDGKYSLRYTYNSAEKPSILEISKGSYRKLQNTKIVDSGNLILVSYCLYIFKSSVYTSVDTAGVSGLINRSFGAACTEVSGSNMDTIFFRTTYCGNLRITQNIGQLIKIKYGL